VLVAVPPPFLLGEVEVCCDVFPDLYGVGCHLFGVVAGGGVYACVCWGEVEEAAENCGYGVVVELAGVHTVGFCEVSADGAQEIHFGDFAVS